MEETANALRWEHAWCLSYRNQMCQEEGGEREGCGTGLIDRLHRPVKITVKSLVFMLGAFVRDAL